jgi:DNA-directed RNA polymerase subunit alpha
VKIEGVLHEFSPIPGVVEDATDVILNLKQIPLKLHGDAPKRIYLKGSEPGKYTSANIEHDADIEILDKAIDMPPSVKGSLQIEMRMRTAGPHRRTELMKSASLYPGLGTLRPESESR